MNLAQEVIQDLTAEAAMTRKLLERIPEDQFSYRPHEKSMTIGQLASHIVESLDWIRPTLETTELSLKMSEYQPYLAENRKALLEKLDTSLEQARKSLEGASEEAMHTVWRMFWDGQLVLELPRHKVMRATILNHLIHHRGQLTVYLRLLEVPLPALIGPSADEAS